MERAPVTHYLIGTPENFWPKILDQLVKTTFLGEFATAVKLINKSQFGDLDQWTSSGARGFLLNSLNSFERTIENLTKEIIDIGI